MELKPYRIISLPCPFPCDALLGVNQKIRSWIDNRFLILYQSSGHQGGWGIVASMLRYSTVRTVCTVCTEAKK